MSSFSLAAIEDKRLSSTAPFPRVWIRWLCHFNDYQSKQLFDSRIPSYLAVFTRNKNPAYNFLFGKCCDTAKVHTWKRDMGAKWLVLRYGWRHDGIVYAYLRATSCDTEIHRNVGLLNIISYFPFVLLIHQISHKYQLALFTILAFYISSSLIASFLSHSNPFQVLRLSRDFPLPKVSLGHGYDSDRR